MKRGRRLWIANLATAPHQKSPSGSVMDSLSRPRNPCSLVDLISAHHVPSSSHTHQGLFVTPHTHTHTYFHHLLFPPSKLSVLSLVRACVLCVQSLEKLAHPTISSSGVHFPSVGTSENEHFWMKWSGTWHSNPNLFRPFIFFPPCPGAESLRGEMEQDCRPVQVFSDQPHFTGVEIFLFYYCIGAILTSGSAFKFVHCTSV